MERAVCFVNSYSLDKYDLPSNNLAPTLGWNSGEMRIKLGCEKIIWPCTFEDNCSSSANMTGLVTEY